MGFNFDFLSDPNVIQGMGRAGAALSSGASIGEALDPSELIRQIQMQKASKDLMAQLLAGSQAVPGAGSASSMAPKPTPIGQPGPDSVITKTTADGVTTTIKEPSKENLNTFGTSVPAEAIPAQPAPVQGGAGTSPFLEALFGLK